MRFITPTLYFLLGVALVTALNAAAPTTVGWRDSGEFLLSAYFLDIPHPAGFPLFAQLANSFNLLLPGPIAWRTHSFSCVTAIVLIVQLWFLAKSLLPHIPQRPSLCVAATIATLISTQALYRAITTAEVYSLSAILLVAILQCLTLYGQNKDLRWMYLAAFIGGLSLSNHVVSSLFGIWVLIGLILFKELSPKKVVAAGIFALLGVSTYAYLPARSSSEPPLNTGAPHSLERFVLHVTDARDRDLRPANQRGRPATSAFDLAVSDASRLSSELPWFLLPLCAVGILTLATTNAKFLFYSSGIIITTMGFFMGWDVDPWISATSILLLYAAVGVRVVINYVGKTAPRFSLGAELLVTAACVVQLFTFVPSHYLNRYWSLADESAMNFTKARLRNAPHESLLIADASWFMSKYAQHIEGVAPNVTTVYLPAILFPHYFAPPQLLINQQRWMPQQQSNQTEPGYSNLFSLLSAASEFTAIEIEPNTVANAPLREILLLEADGTLRIEKGKNSFYHPNFINGFLSPIMRLLESSIDVAGVLHDDIDEHARVLLTQMTQTLRDIGAQNLQKELCSSALSKERIVKAYSKTSEILDLVCKE